MAEQGQPEGQSGVTDAVRAAVDQTFAATAGAAGESRERASELLNQLAHHGGEARRLIEHGGNEARRVVERGGTEARRAVERGGNEARRAVERGSAEARQASAALGTKIAEAIAETQRKLNLK